MSLLKFIFFSALEYFSTFVFILVQFRFSIRENLTKILLISTLLSFVSYSFINADISGVFPIVQILIALIYIQMVLKVSVINSLIMFFTGYIVVGLVQTCVIAVLWHVGIIEGELKAGTTIAYQLQIYSSVLMLALSCLTYFMKGGFSFIETRGRFSKKSFTGKKRLFVIFIFFAFIITILSNVVILESKNPPYLLIATVLMFVLISLSYMSLKRDETND